MSGVAAAFHHSVRLLTIKALARPRLETSLDQSSRDVLFTLEDKNSKLGLICERWTYYEPNFVFQVRKMVFMAIYLSRGKFHES